MIKVGILGTGFGEHHARLYKKIVGFELVSIFGRNPEKLKKIGEEINIHTTTNINDIIKDPAIDLLDICLPTELHSKWAIEGLKNGKHIFCETPVSYHFDEAEEIRQVSLKYGKNVYVDMFLKFSTPHNAALMLAKEGEFGKLISVHSYNKTSPRWGDLGIRKNVETFHIHNMDFVQELMGMPKSVTASGIDLDNKSIITSILNYEDKYAVLESDSSLPECCPFGIGFELVFTNGMIQYNAAYGEYTNEEFSILSNNKPREVVKLDMKDEYEEVFRHVLLCLQNKAKSEFIDINAAINTVKLKEMILKSLNR